MPVPLGIQVSAEDKGYTPKTKASFMRILLSWQPCHGTVNLTLETAAVVFDKVQKCKPSILYVAVDSVVNIYFRN